MKETAGSLRIYLLFIGLLGYNDVQGIFRPDATLQTRVMHGFFATVSLAFLVFGLTFKELLAEKPRLVLTFFRGLIVYQVILLAIRGAQLATSGGLATLNPWLLVVLVGPLLSWYLYGQAQRLVRETSGGSQPLSAR